MKLGPGYYFTVVYFQVLWTISHLAIATKLSRYIGFYALTRLPSPVGWNYSLCCHLL